MPRTCAAVIVLACLAGACATAGSSARPSPFPGAAEPRHAQPAAPPPVVASAVQPVRRGVQALVEAAMDLRGVPYLTGGDDPDIGLDCSGLVHYIFGLQGITVPRTVEEQFRTGLPVSTAHIEAGDLVFFSTTGPGATHVGLVVGPDDAFVHAPSERGVVRVDHVSAPYWHARLVGARRVLTHPSFSK